MVARLTPFLSDAFVSFVMHLQALRCSLKLCGAFANAESNWGKFDVNKIKGSGKIYGSTKVSYFELQNHGS